MKNEFNLEVCVDTVESAIAAENGGATRLELCSNLIIGGTTPSVSLLEIVKEHVGIPVHVIIRPRFGDFCYSDLEFEEIKRQVVMVRAHGADGIVIGILKPDGSLDKKRLKTLINLAGHMHIALHRAFDVCKDPFKAMDEAVELGINTILTSGQRQTALEGVELLGDLIKKANGAIDIMLGSGVSTGTITELIQKTHAKSYHMSGKIKKDSKMVYRKQDVSMGLSILSEYDLFQTNEDEIRKAKQIIEKNLI